MIHFLTIFLYFQILVVVVFCCVGIAVEAANFRDFAAQDLLQYLRAEEAGVSGEQYYEPLPYKTKRRQPQLFRNRRQPVSEPVS